MKMSILHPNAALTGSKMCIELIPASNNEEGYINISLYRQLAASPSISFDEKCSVVSRLYFSDLTKVISVFRGETESADDGPGLFHYYGSHHSAFQMTHRLEPEPSYLITIINRNGVDGENVSCGFSLTMAEALGLLILIEDSLRLICFGK